MSFMSKDHRCQSLNLKQTNVKRQTTSPTDSRWRGLTHPLSTHIGKDRVFANVVWDDLRHGGMMICARTEDRSRWHTIGEAYIQ